MKTVATKQARREPPVSKESAAKTRPAKARPAKRPDVAPGTMDAASLTAAHEQIVREAAYFVYERSGRVDGRELENWLQAEAELSLRSDEPGPTGEPLPS